MNITIPTPTPPMLPSRPRQSVFNETYRNKHREKYNAYMKEYQRIRRNDPVVKAKIRGYQYKYYEKKKAQKLARAQ